jgi:hypothetical protein
MSKVGTASKEELDLAKPELDKIFYGETHMMGSRPKFWNTVKDMGIPYRVVNAYYENQRLFKFSSQSKSRLLI